VALDVHHPQTVRLSGIEGPPDQVVGGLEGRIPLRAPSPAAPVDTGNSGLAHRGSNVSFGEFGLKATSRARMTAREIEAARRAMARYVKRGGQIWIRVFPDVPISKKPLEVRMGSGKGNVEYYVARVQPGKVLFEMEGVDEATAREAFRLAGSKLSVSTTFAKRQVR